ncbi:MAG: accessory factor UbiK family protein [Alphaproteobacteria bacterium]|nr:accessory factor UbiK family protein [Alphaproteobacteria bacterium]
MQTDNRFLDDIARLATSAIGTLQNARDEATQRIRDQFERLIAGMDLVKREEFDAVKAMAQKARMENERLAARIAALETAIAAKAVKRKPRVTARKR